MLKAMSENLESDFWVNILRGLISLTFLSGHRSHLARMGDLNRTVSAHLHGVKC